jgi:hypothetical protein
MDMSLKELGQLGTEGDETGCFKYFFEDMVKAGILIRPRVSSSLEAFQGEEPRLINMT